MTDRERKNIDILAMSFLAVDPNNREEALSEWADKVNRFVAREFPDIPARTQELKTGQMVMQLRERIAVMHEAGNA